jgi:hypothetical protein
MLGQEHARGTGDEEGDALRHERRSYAARFADPLGAPGTEVGTRWSKAP